EGDTKRTLSPDALAALSRRAWPGNVRELRNVLKRAVVMTSAPVLTAADLKLDAAGPHREPDPSAPAAAIEVADDLPLKDARDRWVAPMEREYLVRVLRRCGGDLDKATEEAGLHRKSFER